MSAACDLALALMTTCAIVPPDGKPPVTVTRACVRQFSTEERTAAISCAAENGVPWRFVRGQKQKSEGQ